MKPSTWWFVPLALALGCGDAGSPPFKISEGAASKTTPSGLKMEDVVTGNGAEAKVGDRVVVNYTGWLTNGKKFDSSLDRNSPFTIVLGAGKVIKGWDEGLVGMKKGGKRRLEIPPELGYGKAGAGQAIPPDATLLFEIDLLEIKPGVMIEDIKEGTGQAAKAGDNILVHYTGKLQSGKVFDSSLTRDMPFPVTLGAGKVIPGWDAGLVGMKVGGKRKLTIPPELAYGEQGYRDTIPPNATLTFDIELLKIGSAEEIYSPLMQRMFPAQKGKSQ